MKKKKSPKPITFIWLIVFIVLFVSMVKNGVDRHNSIERLKEQYAKEISEGNKKTDLLLNELSKIESDTTIEFLAKDKLGYIKSDEEAYKVLPGGHN